MNITIIKSEIREVCAQGDIAEYPQWVGDVFKRVLKGQYVADKLIINALMQARKINTSQEAREALIEQVNEAIYSGWTDTFPEWVTDSLTRLLYTHGPVPVYGVEQTNKALKVAKAIIDKMESQLAMEPVEVKIGGHRKNTTKAERDRQLREAMKGDSKGGGGKPVTDPNSKKGQKQAARAQARK